MRETWLVAARARRGLARLETLAFQHNFSVRRKRWKEQVPFVRADPKVFHCRVNVLESGLWIMAGCSWSVFTYAER